MYILVNEQGWFLGKRKGEMVDEKELTKNEREMTERKKVAIPDSDAFLLVGKSANVALRKRKKGKALFSLFVPVENSFSVSSLYAISEERAIEKAVKRLNRDKDRGHDD